MDILLVTYNFKEPTNRSHPSQQSYGVYCQSTLGQQSYGVATHTQVQTIHVCCQSKLGENIAILLVTYNFKEPINRSHPVYCQSTLGENMAIFQVR